MAGIITPEWFEGGELKYLRQIRASYLDSYNAVVARLSARIKSEFDGEDISRFATTRMKAVRKVIAEEIAELDKQITKITGKAVSNVQLQIGGLAAASGLDEAFNTFIARNVKPYVYKGAFLRDFMVSTSRNYTKELLTKAESVLRMGVIQRQSWGEVVTSLRQNAWGLEPFQRATGITYKAERLARTELARQRWLTISEFVNSTDKVIGVRTSYGGGPCPSGVCYSAVGEYYKDGSGKGWPMPEYPLHPNCRCAITEIVAMPEYAEKVAA